MVAWTVNQREVHLKTPNAKTMMTAAALSLCAASLAACAANPGVETPAQVANRGPDACFRNTDIINVNMVDEKTLYVATRRGYVYRLNSPGGCFVQLAPVTVGPLHGDRGGVGTCVGARTTVATSGAYCVADVTGPYTDSRQSGLWSRNAAP